jgi:hypothetical protein
MNDINKELENSLDDEMIEIETISLELEDGTIEECEVLDMLEIEGKTYVSLLPLDTDEYYVYGCKVIDEDLEIINIESDVEYEKIVNIFEEFYESLDEEDIEEETEE